MSQVRGQPLVAFLAVLAGWIGGRAATWEAPVLTGTGLIAVAQRKRGTMPERGFVMDRRTGPQSFPQAWVHEPQKAYPADSPSGIRPVDVAGIGEASRRTVPAGRTVAFAGTRAGAFATWYPDELAWGPSAMMFKPASGSAHRAARLARGGLSATGLLPEPSRAAVPGGIPPAVPSRAATRRWSADAWALLRRDLASARSQGALPAVYGASQVGAVLRYRLNRTSHRRPAAYLRATAALGMMGETSAALGLSARPLSALPIVAAVEGRMTDQAGGRRFQPAAFAYTELPSMRLPLGLRTETYVQAGYVGGAFATPFADGQFRLDRRVLALGRGEVRLGGGLWAGAQKGAERFDAGPSAFVALPLGHRMFSRVALDWRFRVAGDAEPGSGPAVTLSAGF